MDWSAPVDIYCERTDASFWSEPLNAVSNLAFILAALWASREACRRGIGRASVWLLIALAFVIGTGSFLFHTFATRWAGMADTLPILIFILAYAVTALALIGHATPERVTLYTVTMAGFFTATGFGIAQLNLDLNGTEGYLPALAAMIVISALTWSRSHPATPWFVGATLTFALSLTFRSFDMALCDVWPYGTHVFWHLLNGTVIALLLQALIRNTTRTEHP
ncbi:ceramidase domain-containing protein [Marimonas sp. MJW-29]|uniref:Ceramidase domain-containing protein n=1 Tax=Sulfitobacter sediminis TaxID=3234186 RepID=A0ABV3RJE7_9RHOB